MSNSKLMIPGRIQWWGGPSIHQRFSFPKSIIYYIAKHPLNSKVYSKLIKTCKFFFEINPVLVVANMYYVMGDNDAIRICPDKECNEIPNYASLLCSKIYQCEVIKLGLCFQNIVYEDFKILIPCVKEIHFYNFEMRYADGSCVMLESIIEAMPNIEVFTYTFKPGHSVVDTTTMKKIAALGNLGHLRSFRLQNIPGSFKVQDLSDFIMSHADTKFFLCFGDFLSGGYKAEVDALFLIALSSIMNFNN